MRTLLLLVATFALAGPAAAQPRPADRAATPDGPAWYACRVTLDLGNGHLSAGSGTPVHVAGGKTLVLTNAHVVPGDTKDARVAVTAGGKTYPARIVDGSPVRFRDDGRMEVDGPDLCVVEVDADLGAVPVAGAAVPGDAVFQRGYGGTRPGEASVLRRGRIAAAGGELGLSYAVDSGDSGSGVLNEAGELVGVTVGRDPATHKGYAIPAAAVRAFLLRPRLGELHPPLAARLTGRADPAPAVEAPAADAPADANGLPATVVIDGKTYTRVPGTREYVRDPDAPATMR